jgi:SAM-dependent methyltransferase
VARPLGWLRDAQLLRQRVGRLAHPVPEPDRAPADFSRQLAPRPLARDDQPVTRLLFERLAEADVAEIARRVSEHPELPALDPSFPAPHRWLTLSYGIWLGIDAVGEKTGLPTVQPPEQIHAMVRGPLAAAGGLYEADMVAAALATAGVSLEATGAGLDFGCSSGRVLRVLAAAYPDTRWIGCDPNEPAIEWARANLSGIEFFVNPQQPPLGVEYGSLDLVYAISIWSHFAPELGLRWFDEMHRLIRPGGHLICTTHGLTSLALAATEGHRPPAQAEEIMRSMYRFGGWYAAEFGPEGDSGVVNPSWGTTFLTPEWMLTTLTPLWRVLAFAPGRNQSNQDVYVLERV